MHQILHIQLAICSASFLLCFSALTSLGFVTPTLSGDLLSLGDPHLQLVCKPQLIPIFLDTVVTINAPASGIKAAPPLHWGVRIRLAILYWISSTLFLGFFASYYLPGCPWPWSSLFLMIAFQMDYCKSDFPPSHLTLHITPRICTLQLTFCRNNVYLKSHGHPPISFHSAEYGHCEQLLIFTYPSNNPYIPARLKTQLSLAAQTPQWLLQIPNQLKMALPGWILGDLCWSSGSVTIHLILLSHKY